MHSWRKCSLIGAVDPAEIELVVGAADLMGVEVTGPVETEAVGLVGMEKAEAVEIAMCVEVRITMHGDVLTGMDLAAIAMARVEQENQLAEET